MRGLTERHGGGRFATLLDESGAPPCRPPDDCDVCRLFDPPRPSESRREWYARITGGEVMMAVADERGARRGVA